MEEKQQRTTVASMDELIGVKFPVLDHGFIRVIDYMGDDLSICQAARISYKAGSKGDAHDEALIRYLLKHKHTTPFEMCDIKFHVKVPIFVARQWHRHRTASINEVSARYTVMPSDYYIPDLESLAIQSTDNKQGRMDQSLEVEAGSNLSNIMQKSCQESYDNYTRCIKEYDLTRELARTVLPQSMYTEYYWKINLHNLFHFLRLRADKHAQKEIRVYAEIILEEIVSKWVPMAYRAFKDYQVNAVTLSATDIAVLAKMMEKTKAEQFIEENLGSKSREQDALATIVQKIMATLE